MSMLPNPNLIPPPKAPVPAFGPFAVVNIDASATDDDPGAVQSFAEECDINNIMRDVQNIGMTDWINARRGTYEDITVTDFQECMDTIIRAQEAFEELPSGVRDRFANDPVKFLDFVHTEGNEAELVKLGLTNPSPKPFPKAEPPDAPAAA